MEADVKRLSAVNKFSDIKRKMRYRKKAKLLISPSISITDKSEREVLH